MFSNWTDEPETRRSRGDGRPVWVTVAVLVVTLTWLAATAWAVLRVLLDAGTELSGALGPWSSGEISFDPQPLMVAVVVAAGPPALGLVIALSWRRPSATVLLAACAVLGGLSLVMLVASAEGSPAPEHHVCQEHSGGDNVCPGD
jgi:hypothetical protein